MRTTAALLLLTASAVLADFDNNPPVPGTRPQYKTGTNTVGIDIEIIYDLMCSDSKDQNPAFQSFLASTWNGALVKDQIEVTYTFLPLPYHHETWIPHKLVPYFLDVCQFTPTSCIMYDYIEYCFAHQDDILDKKDISQDDIIASWVTQVAANFKLTESDLSIIYTSDDTHDSESRTRYMYKYNAHHHNSGTPFAYVNGILLENFPTSADDWTTMLQTVYDSQYKPPTPKTDM